MVDEEQQYEQGRDESPQDAGGSLIYRMPAEKTEDVAESGDMEEPLPVELTGDEPPLDQQPIDEPPLDQQPVEEPLLDQQPIEEPPFEEPPADEPPVEEPPAEAQLADEVVADGEESADDPQADTDVDDAQPDDITAAMNEAGVPDDDAATPQTEAEAIEESAEVADDAPATTDAAPEPMVASVAEGETTDAGGDLGWKPFVAYDAAWVVFVGLLIWQLLEVPAGRAAYESALYPLFLIAGITLLVAGPFLIWVLWWTGRTAAGRPAGLFTALLYRGAVATFAGVALWWAALFVVDFLRLGRLL